MGSRSLICEAWQAAVSVAKPAGDVGLWVQSTWFCGTEHPHINLCCEGGNLWLQHRGRPWPFRSSGGLQHALP